jgi:hypothetical protein
VRARALRASEHLRQRLKKELFPENNDEPRSNTIGSASSQLIKCLYYVVNSLGIGAFIRRLISVTKGYAYEKVLAFQTPFTFLDRMKKASRIKPLKKLADAGHLFDAKEMYKNDVKTELEAKEASLGCFKRAWKKSSLEALFAVPPDMSKEHYAEHIATQRLEEQRVIANVLALACIILRFSKGNAKSK